jgi:hypothetical protein
MRKTAKQTITKPVVTIAGMAVLLSFEVVTIAGMTLLQSVVSITGMILN